MTDDLIQEIRSRYDAAHITRFFDEDGQREWERLTATPVDEISLYIHTQ